MSAAARAEARRKAILARGTDRLAKLTTSARGDDPAYMHDDPPLPNISSNSRNFLGEESGDMPTPATRGSPSPQPKSSSRTSGASSSERSSPAPPNPFAAGGFPSADPSVWSPEQQQQFMAALMGGASIPPPSPLPQSPLGDPNAPIDPSLPPMDNPLAAMLFPQGAPNGMGMGMGGGFPFAAGKVPAAPVKPPSKLQKLLPLLHLIATWLLLAYFVLWKEPQVNEAFGAGVVGGSVWKRWAELGWRSPIGEGLRAFRVQAVPFFWAFTTLQIALHSLRIFSGFDTVQPPALLALALPHLPPPIPSLIVNAMKYMQMGSLFLDDLAGLVVGIGFIIYFAGLFAK
ncbi:hypothetical protein BDQ12DRAFT_735333 [Crucibulum laeve]|uniref:GET complex, subunit GET2 n=1 Tax=Crucibulum laeve TaxID=68775 RepID=A0A5C3M1R8_9AGAR|nr:hypothetical protein BDQ12DRAFT_735333 [Crucibulum laeve]